MHLPNVLDLNFETHAKHQKSIGTEDSALRIIASASKSLKVELMQRVVPPLRSNVGECDAVIFTDAGVLLVEVKRIGGNILNLNLTSEKVRIEKGKTTVDEFNPAVTVKRKVGLLREYIHGAPEWQRLNKLYEIAGVTGGIPVFPVLCFGPTTNIETDQVSGSDFLVASTRTLRNALEKFLEGRPGVIGGYRHSKIIAHYWRTQGVLSVFRQLGFLRATPLKAFGVVVDFTDVALVEGKKTGVITVGYKDKVKKATKQIRSVVFGTFVRGEWREFDVNQHQVFTWRAGG